MALPGSFQGNAGTPDVQPIKQLVDDFLAEVQAVSNEHKLFAAVNILRPSSFYIVADRDSVHVVYKNVPPSGLPYVMIDDIAASNPELAGHALAILQAVEAKNGWTDCEVESLPRGLIAAQPENRRHALRTIASHYLQEYEAAARMAATEAEIRSLLASSPPAAASLVDGIRAAVADIPADRSVFVMMRYQESEHFGAIERSISASLATYGLSARYAKDKAYSDDLWENVRIYAHVSKYGLAVFEEIDTRSFNPNVSIELGYMYALGRRVLLLKERRMPTMPTDIVGRIYRTFDVFHIESSIAEQIRQWAQADLGLGPVNGTHKSA